MLFERKSLNDVLNATPELRVNGDWLCLNVETSTPWPTEPQPLVFEGRNLWLMPYTTDNYPGIAFNRTEDIEREDAWALLHRALSLLAWVENSGGMVAHMTGGNLPRMMGLGKTSGIAIRDSFDFSDLPNVTSDRARLALALMREGRGLNHPAYAFLSFFRVLETAIPDGPTRGAWVTSNIENIYGNRAREALDKLKETVSGDIGVHLRDSGRHAIAHAKADPIINPDDPRDARRLRAELPIIEALAVLAVEKHLGVQTSHTIWSEHLYELKGWKPIFGDALITDILEGADPSEGLTMDAPRLNVRLRKSSPFAPMENMHPIQAAFGKGWVEMTYQSDDELVDFRFWLNFEKERLEFDIDHSIAVRDDRSAGAARNAQHMARFFRDYFGNGELQMWNAETGALMSRCDAFLPLNCYLDMDAANANIAKWDPIIAKREAES